jgi:hypothetical protein
MKAKIDYAIDFKDDSPLVNIKGTVKVSGVTSSEAEDIISMMFIEWAEANDALAAGTVKVIEMPKKNKRVKNYRDVEKALRKERLKNILWSLRDTEVHLKDNDLHLHEYLMWQGQDNYRAGHRHFNATEVASISFDQDRNAVIIKLQ